MVSVAGASQYASAVAYNLSKGIDPLAAASSPSLLGGFDSNISLLEIGKQFSAEGIGLSPRARAVTNKFLSKSSSGLNTILSASPSASIDGAKTQILALQAKLPASSVGTFSNRGTNVDQEA